MGNLSEMIMRRPPSPDTLHQAEAWASQALAVTKKARAESSKPIDPCEEVYAAALFNLATFRNVSLFPRVSSCEKGFLSSLFLH